MLVNIHRYLLDWPLLGLGAGLLNGLPLLLRLKIPHATSLDSRMRFSHAFITMFCHILDSEAFIMSWFPYNFIYIKFPPPNVEIFPPNCGTLWHTTNYILMCNRIFRILSYHKINNWMKQQNFLQSGRGGVQCTKRRHFSAEQSLVSPQNSIYGPYKSTNWYFPNEKQCKQHIIWGISSICV